MATAADIMDDAVLNAIHEAHIEAGEPQWDSCPMCDPEDYHDEAAARGFERPVVTESEARVLDGNR